MKFLDFFFIVSGVLLLFLSFDIARKQRFNILHFFGLLSIWVWLLVFTFFPQVLEAIGRFFGIPRWADALVYVSIISIFYLLLILLTKHFETKESITKLVRELAISASDKSKICDEVVILIRAYNESETIAKVLDRVIAAWYHSILLVDDGSSDNSKQIYKKYQDKVYTIHHKVNRWAGAALETGFEYLRRYGDCKYVVCFDADWQHDITDLPRFFVAFNQNPSLEFVIGSRFLKTWNAINMPFFRKIILLWGKIFTRIMSHIKLSDAHNGYRVFRYNVLDNISLSIDGMGYASELIEQIARQKIPYTEVPVTIHYTDYSISKWQKSSNAINIALRFIWTKFFR